MSCEHEIMLNPIAYLYMLNPITYLYVSRSKDDDSVDDKLEISF